MRALESLIKKHGGLKNIKKANAHFYDYLFHDFIENLKKQNNLNESDIKNKGELNNLFIKLAEHVITAYNKLKYDDNNVCSHFPLCVAIALAFNLACHEFKNFKNYNGISNHEEWIRKEIAKYKSDDKKALEWCFGNYGKNMFAHERGADYGFTWDESPEGHGIWHSVWTWLKTQSFPKFSTAFTSFIEAHPDSEEEIKNFYK